MCLLIMVYPSFGGDMQKIMFFPQILPTYGGMGECAYIWYNDSVVPVTLYFEKKLDRMMYDRLIYNIQIAPYLICKNNKDIAPPCLYFKGYISKDNDKSWNRCTLIIRKWLITSPFYVMDSELDIIVDYSLTKQKNELTQSDFYDLDSNETRLYYNIKEKINFNKIKSRYELVERKNDVYIFPVVGIDVNSQQVDLLTNHYPLKYLKCPVIFKDKKMKQCFFSTENEKATKIDKQIGEGPLFFLRGIYNQNSNCFHAIDVITELK